MQRNKFSEQIKTLFSESRPDYQVNLDNSIRITFICTGNICRSALAEKLLAGDLDQCDNYIIDSMGTAALVGRDIHPKYKVKLDGLPDLLVNHSARLVNDSLQKSSIILCMDDEHGHFIRRHYPKLSNRVFLLTEFTQYIELLQGENFGSIREAFSKVFAQRNIQQDFSGIEDPYGKENSVFENVYEQIRNEVNIISNFILTHEKDINL